MTHPLTTLSGLKRPRLLINAARIGVSSYRRETHLQRHLGEVPTPESTKALAQLLELEDGIETDRRNHNAGYSAALHIEVLIAMMGEARLAREMV